MYSKRFLTALFCIVAIAFLFSQANAAGTASWYYRGTAISSNTSLSLNTGDALTIQCLAVSISVAGAGRSPLFAVMFASSSSTNPVLTVTFTAGTTPTPLAAAVTASSGTLIYDSFNGAAATWSHWLISTSVILPAYSVTTNSMSRGMLSIFIPKLVSTDAGTLYCVFADGAAAITNLAFSNAFTLSLTTKSGTVGTSGSTSASSTIVRNKYLEYSMLLMGSSKLIL